MISQKAIQYLYQEYNKRPESPDYLNFGILFDIPEELHNIKLDEECLEIGSISDNSPFHKITLNHINAIVDLEENIAIVLNNSIIFLSKISKEISIDIRQYTPTLIDKISHLFGF